MKTENFKEDDIRPDRFLEQQLKAIKEDIEYLLSRKSEFVKIDCPACGGKKSVFYFDKSGFDYFQCLDCQTVFLNSRPSQEVIHDFYSISKNYSFWNKYIFPASEKVRKEKIFIPRVDKVLEFCKKYSVGTGVLLEVGAGFGTFCEEVKNRNVFKRVIAVEPTPDLAETCRQKGLEVLNQSVEKLSLDENSVDLISCFEVVEHLFNPRVFLENCKRYLKKGGFFVLSCPNFLGFDIITLRELSDSVDHEHLNYFNPGSLSTLLENIGFEVIEMQTPGKLDADIVRKRALDGVIDLSDAPFLKHILIDRWNELGRNFQTFLSDNLLSSHLWVVARNK